jgi:hypothetical protein
VEDLTLLGQYSQANFNLGRPRRHVDHGSASVEFRASNAWLAGAPRFELGNGGTLVTDCYAGF